MGEKMTMVLGASPNPARYSFKAVELLREKGHEVWAFGKRSGSVSDVDITDRWPSDAIDTVTLYLNPTNQQEYIPRILDLKPRRVIFNPGTENPAFVKQLELSGIEVEVACTLVMLRVGTF